MKNFFICLLVLIFLCGCSPQLRTLISLSSEQEAQKKYLDSQSRKFKLLLEHIKRDRLKLGLSQSKIINLYGEPITIKNIDEQSIFLYREPRYFFPSEKVYLFFNKQGLLTNFEFISKEPTKDNLSNN